MHSLGDYDLAGFAVGAVERNLILPRPNIAEGDIVLGIASSGLHSNGFSLVRKILSIAGVSYDSPCPWQPDTELGRVLLTPTQIYIKQILPVAKRGLLKGMSHITGGGFIENIPRALPKNLGCYVDAAAWDLPPVFNFLMKHGQVDALEMARTFNCGVGMVLIVDPSHLDEVIEGLKGGPSAVYKIGEVTAKPGVEMRNVLRWSV